jgi:hypothetical protein
MNEFLAAAPRAEVAHGAVGCMVSLDDLSDRPPRRLAMHGSSTRTRCGDALLGLADAYESMSKQG